MYIEYMQSFFQSRLGTADYDYQTTNSASDS
jgi:hypothetical protein